MNEVTYQITVLFAAMHVIVGTFFTVECAYCAITKKKPEYSEYRRLFAFIGALAALVFTIMGATYGVKLLCQLTGN